MDLPEVYRTDEYKAFVKGMREDESNVARLACADFLEENRQYERAQFIRDSVAGVRMGHAIAFGQWPVDRLQRCVRDWWSTSKAEATCGMSYTKLINWRGEWGTGDPYTDWAPVATTPSGFIYHISSPVKFFLVNLDELYEREPIRSVCVMSWDSQGPDGNPIINPNIYHTRNPDLIFVVAGRHVIVPKKDWLALHETGRQIPERAIAELVFRHRWPGVAFEVHI